MKDAQQEIIEEQNRRIIQLLIERDLWQAKAEEKIALRREIETALGIETVDTNDEALAKGVKALRQRDRLDQQLTAHKAALNLCEMALHSDMYGTFTELRFESLSAIAKLKGNQ